MTSTPPIEALDWSAVDRAYLRHLEDHPDLAHRWLLVQTLATGSSRRALLGALGAVPGDRVLDVGTGMGPIPLELAGMVPVDVVGIDTDPVNLATATELAGALGEASWFRPGSSVAFGEGDIYAIPAAAASFDLATVRMVFQYLEEPRDAADELFRVVRPGGGVCIIDADDGLSIVYPPPSDAFARLQRAFGELQAARGGDRFVGRKLSTYLEQSGFDIVTVLVLPQAVHGPSLPTDVSRAFSLDRLSGARDEIVERGILRADEVDHCLEMFAGEHSDAQCNIEAHLAVVARRPG